MKEHGILFQGEMVRAILAGTKTETRRILKLPKWSTGSWDDFKLGVDGLPYAFQHNRPEWGEITSRYGNVGDHLYVKETWQAVSPDEQHRPLDECDLVFRATDEHPGLWDEKDTSEPSYAWRPSIFLPKRLARIWLTRTVRRYERLQDIGPEDIEAEGAPMTCLTRMDRLMWFRNLWRGINGEESWNENPLVEVIGFGRLEK